LAYAPIEPNRNPLTGPYYNAASYGKAVYYKAAPPGPPPWAAWAQGMGDWERRGALNANDFARSQSTYGTQGGFDYLWRQVIAPGDYFVTGLFGSFMSSRAGFSTLPFGVRVEGPGAGAYAMWINGGLSTDVTARGDFFNVVEDFAGVTPSLSLRVSAPGVSENIQYKYWLNGFGGPTFFEPTMGYMYTRALFDGSGAAFGLKDATTLRLQAGARIGSVFDLNGTRVVSTLTALVYDNTIQRGTALSTNPTLPIGVVLPLVPTDQGLLRGEVIPELNFYFGNGLSAFLQGGVRFGREMVGGTAKVGLMREW
jgi:outer membrane autotransporter protein